MKARPDISIVVPVYKSAGILPELVNRLSQALTEINHEIILTDDCSPDESWKVIKSLSKEFSNVHGIRLGKNAGQFMSTLAGISRTQGTYIVTIDDDLEYDPKDVLKLYHRICSGDYYLVFGIAPAKYKIQHQNPLFAYTRNRFINFIWKKFPTDSFRIFHRNTMFDSDGKFVPKIHFEAFVNHYISADRVAYEEVSYHQRYEGSSNHSLPEKVRIFIKYSIEYYPLPVFPLAMILGPTLICAVLLEFFLFSGKATQLLLYTLSASTLFIALLVLGYISHIYRVAKNLPPYRIIESTS